MADVSSLEKITIDNIDYIKSQYVYYKILITEFMRNGSIASVISMAELYLYDSSNNDMAHSSNCVLNASSELSSAYTVTNIIDNDITKIWHKADIPDKQAYIIIRLPKTLPDVASIGIIPRQDINDRINAFSFYKSTDGLIFNLIKSFSNLYTTNKTEKKYTL